MKLVVCTIYDSAAGAYAQPLYFRSKGEAIRSFIDAVKDEKGPFARHAKDYTFMQCGVFDDQTGIFEMMDVGKPVPVISALEAVARE